jgi:hypothetical protein
LAVELHLAVVTGDVLGSDEALSRLYGRDGHMVTARRAAAWFLGPPTGELHKVWLAVSAPENPDEETADAIARLVREQRPTITDERTAARLRASGVDIAGCAVGIDPLTLLYRHVDTDVLERRAALLRLLGCLPDSGPALAIEIPTNAPTDLYSHLMELAQAREADSVLISDDPVDLGNRLGAVRPAPRRLPRTTGVDDLLATLSVSAIALVATDTLRLLAQAFEVPTVSTCTSEREWDATSALPQFEAEIERRLIKPPKDATLKPAGHTPAAEVAIDEELDRISALAFEATARPNAPAMTTSLTSATSTQVDVDALLNALEVLRRRLVDERTMLQAEVSRLQARLGRITTSWPYRAFERANRTYKRLRSRS